MRNAGITSRNSSRSSSTAPVRHDGILWLAVFALLCCGVTMVYSSSFIFAKERFGNGYFFIERHLVFSAAGIACFFVGRHVPAQRLRRLALPCVLLCLVALSAALIPGLSHRAGGARRWVAVAGVALFQPAELAKISVVLYVAYQLAKTDGRDENWRSGFLSYFLGLIPVYALLVAQPDFGTVALLLCVTVCMLVGSGVRLRYLAAAASAIVPAAVILIATSPYRRARLAGFLDPWSDPAHKGFQVIQSFLAFFSGSWWGVGIGNSHEKLFYLPEAHNDFIFAVIGEEWGVVRALLVPALVLIIVLRGLSAAGRLGKHRPFERALAVGISSLVGLQAFFNMGVVLGLLPTKGLPLPLISYGGTSLVATLFLLGVLSRLSEAAD